MSLDILRRGFIVVFYAGRAASVKRIRALRSSVIEIRSPSRSRTAVNGRSSSLFSARGKHSYASFTAFFTAGRGRAR